MKDGQKEKQLRKGLALRKAINASQWRIWEFLQDINGRFSNKRAIADMFAITAVACAMLDKSDIVIGSFITAATGAGWISTAEKKQPQE
jgi:hypothetical protein